MTNTLIAPGAHIEVRDAIWRVTKVIRREGEDQKLNREEIRAVGVSELVRDQEVSFIPLLESLGHRSGIKVLDPRETELVRDSSSGHIASRLYIESSLRRTPPSDDRVQGDEVNAEPNLYLGSQAALDAMPFQQDPARLALRRPRQRILIADNVGLGKTLSCGILISELILRGRGKRILVVTQKSMLSQFQREMWTRFTIPLVRLDSVGLQRVRAKIPAQHNPFNHYDRVIISIDTLKQQNHFKGYLEKSHWDIIVIDEAQNVAVRGKGRSMSNRAELAQMLSTRSESLILLSATPHDGKPESFASLMNMLDPTAISDPQSFTQEEIKDLYLRRFKKDVAGQLAESCPEREVHNYVVEAGGEENIIYHALQQLKLAEIDGKQTQGYRHLFKVLLKKSFLSSPVACLQTIQNRVRTIKNRGEKEPEYLDRHQADLNELEDLIPRVAGLVERGDDAKYQQLLQLLTQKKPFKLGSKDRVVIFTERVDTMKALARRLYQDITKLRLEDKDTYDESVKGRDISKAKILTLSGQMSDVEIQQVVELFGQAKSDLRILVASDVASEGLNLHFQCHRLIHYDIPWSLMVFLQRNGRIDRYGQRETPHIAYLTYQFEDQASGDQWVLEKLKEREKVVHENLGDPTLLTGAYTIEDEEEQVAEAITEGQAQAINFAAPFDLNAFLQDAVQTQQYAGSHVGTPSLKGTKSASLPSLFKRDFEYFTEGLKFIAKRDQDKLELTINTKSTSAHKEESAGLIPPADLRRRFKKLPKESLHDPSRVLFYPNAEAMQQQIVEARGSDSPWPKVQYLWRNSPVMEWLGDRIDRSFTKQCAPVLRSKELKQDETALLVYAVLPSIAGTPLYQETYVHLVHQGTQRLIPFEEFLAERPFLCGPMSNPEKQLSDERLAQTQSLVSQTIDHVLAEVAHERSAREARLKTFIQSEMSLLEERRALRETALYQHHSRTQDEPDSAEGDTDQPTKQKKATGKVLKDELAKSEKLFESEKTRLQERFTMEAQPFVKIIAVIVNGGE